MSKRSLMERTHIVRYAKEIPTAEQRRLAKLMTLGRFCYQCEPTDPDHNRFAGTGYVCTRVPRHKGIHVAHDSMRTVLATWERIPEELRLDIGI